MVRRIANNALTGYAMLISVLLLVMYGCDRAPSHDERLLNIYELSDSKPHEALRQLDSIPQSALSEPDRHFHDLLTVRLRDKAYIKPSGDDSIKALLAYYESHERKTLYPEVLYYAGRTYSDLGDYPCALDYFQKALSELPEDDGNIHLRGNVLSQLGRLLNNFRLYEEAIPYLKKSLDIGRQEKDTLNMMYDLQLLGRVKMDAGHIEEAKEDFEEALSLSEKFGKKAIARSRMYLASVALEEKNLQLASQLIKDTPETVSALTEHQAMALAAEIYYESGNLDSAYLYAKKLIASPDDNYWRNGYHILLQQDLLPYINSDSIPNMAIAYEKNIQKHFDENEKELILVQQSSYNYASAQQDKEKAYKRNETLRKYLFSAVAVILLLIIGILSFTLNQHRHKNRLFKILSYLNQLSRRNKDDISGNDNNISHIVKLDTTSQLRSIIETELERLKSAPNVGPKISVDYHILKSSPYAILKTMVEKDTCISATSTLLKDLERTIFEVSKSFRDNLDILTAGKITTLEYETALLMKCGFGTKDISVLLGRSISAISQRMDSLARKMVELEIDKKTLRNVINVL